MLHSSSPIDVPIHVYHGKKEGPCLVVTAAIHGDEINGVEIIRRLQRQPQLRHVRGSLICIPVVNVYGFILQSRYLPDRRDLNRQFPGRDQGSLASRLAHLMMTEIFSKASHMIDLHTGAIHRSNYPQIRLSHQCTESMDMAEAFAAPIIVPSGMRDGSLRHAADLMRIPMIVYEAGEALRLDNWAIKSGLRGIVRVMEYLEMFPPSLAKALRHSAKAAITQSSFWIRAPGGGMVIDPVPLGSRIKAGAILAMIVDPLGNQQHLLKAPCEGVVIGKTNIPLVNEGDALFHLGIFEDWHQLDLSINADPDTTDLEP
ncbi:MAG: succinylglutamate desuccinylase/aspartoacylase family protein [Legionellaceae bacterium]|nr:succinylglutamate desuccinylase/aspartoacylase family protein [Legionellaceae bacterium]